ncbi:MAG: adenine phosphoribosyltransferase [Endomicrobiales bacterium]|nr:adenine phosphoribosyltransferase [Endomicrobiales bacterium]
MPKQSVKLKKAIRDIPDFPKPGIIFKDITTLLAKPDLYKKTVNEIARHYKDKGIQKVLCVESRGFIIGAPVAYKLGAGFVPVRKKGKLPYKTVSASYSLEYGTDTLEMHEDAIQRGEKILIVDDLLATGGTMGAVIELVNKLGGKIEGIAFIIELGFLKGREKLKGHDVLSLIQY